MRRGLLSVCCVLLASGIAGCGGSSHKHAGAQTSSASSSAPAPPPGASPGVQAAWGRVLSPGEMKGWVAQSQRTVGATAASWIATENVFPTQRAAEDARLQRLGFSGAVSERLVQASGGPGEVVSLVIGFRSPSAARTHMAREVRAIREGGISAEARPVLIPGGKGFVRTSLPSSYLWLLYTRGSYFYSLNSNHPFGRLNPPTLFDLIIAANQQYARVGG